MRAYSQDLRHQVLRAVDDGKSRAEIIDHFQVSRATIKRYVKQRRETGTVLPRPIPGRPSKKGAALQMGVQELLETHPEASQKNYCQWWEAERGMRVSRASMSRAIHAIGPIAKKGKEHQSERAIEEEPLPKLIKQVLEKRWGGCSDHALQKRRSMIQGSNHPRTARSATGPHRSGRELVS